MRPTKRVKKKGLLNAYVIALIHDRVHELNLIPGRHVFLTQRDWLKRDLDWLIEHCGCWSVYPSCGGIADDPMLIGSTHDPGATTTYK